MNFQRIVSVAAAMAFSLGISAFFAHPAKAAGRYRDSSGPSGFGTNVPVSGGIAMPGSTTATFTNPAGLVGNHSERLSAQAGSTHPMDNPNYRALALVGNGMFGASGGVDYYVPDNGPSQGDAVYGLAVDVSALDLALGVSGRSGIKGSKGTDFNAGLLFAPMQYFTIGATAFGLKGNVDSYGLGVGLNLAPGVDLVGDSVFDTHFKNPEFKPGIKFSNADAGLSVSYGTGATEQFAKNVSAAAYFRVGMNSEIDFEYNHGGDLSKYYAALSFGF
ncbi:MAG: hypothetical protein H7301_07890 [Cryobacterium sp.]|nr:hypothetical protein [Oligoflexia bacterium]